MYCPRCGTEYRAGFSKCSDCRTPLVGGQPHARDAARAVELVPVLEIHDSFALRLATAALEEAGIEYVISGENPGYLPGFHGASGIGETPFWESSCRILVSREFEDDAHKVLDPLRNPCPLPTDFNETEPDDDR